METRRTNLTVIKTIKAAVDKKAERIADIAKAAVVVVEATIEIINTQEMDQVQKTIVLSMVVISGASATRILEEEIIIILQEEVAEMGKDVVIPILAVAIMVEEVAEAVATTITTTMLVTTTIMNITTWMVCRNKELRILVKEPINSTMLSTII
jgi:hypothetical protein